MRSLGGTLTTAQQAVSGTPYIRLVFNRTSGGNVDYSSKVLELLHVEEPYGEAARIILENSARDIESLIGSKINIGYGFDANYSLTAPLWVKTQQITSAEGLVVTRLLLDGVWAILNNKYVALAEPPFYEYTYTGKTIYEIIEAILDSLYIDLLTLDDSDGLVDVLQPEFDVNNQPYENAATLILRLLSMTKCYIRFEYSSDGVYIAKARIVYPQSADGVDYNYYSDQAHYFYSFEDGQGLVIPNSIAVYCNQEADGSWIPANIITGTALDQDSIDAYYGSDGGGMTILEHHVAGSITTQGDADNRAAALLQRHIGERFAGVVTVPMNCGQELYDRIKVFDGRGV